VVSVDQAIREAGPRRRQLEALADLDPVEDLAGTVQLVLDAGTRLVRVDATACMLVDDAEVLAAVGASDEAALGGAPGARAARWTRSPGGCSTGSTPASAAEAQPRSPAGRTCRSAWPT
jgi:hypothetical protein